MVEREPQYFSSVLECMHFIMLLMLFGPPLASELTRTW